MAFESYVVRFVDSTEVGRVTRLDLNVGQAAGQVKVDGDINLGQSQLERTMADVEGRDGEVVTSDKRVNREVRIPLLVSGDASQFATKMGQIARESDRGQNYLEWWPKGEGVAASAPVFFVASKGEITEPEFEDSGAGVWRFDLTLLCDPTAIGAKESGTATVANDPAAATNPQGFTLPAIKGDVRAPLSVEADWPYVDPSVGPTDDGTVYFGVTPMLALHATGSTALGAVSQADAGTMGTDSSVVANVYASGGSAVETSFATNTTMVDRVVLPVISLPAARYRMLVRVRKAAVGEFRLRFYDAMTGADLVGPTTEYGTTTDDGWHWLELGDFSVPYRGVMPPGHTSAQVAFALQAERVSGTGTLRFDVVRYLPVDVPDAPEAAVSFVSMGNGVTGIGGSMLLGWDGESDQHYTVQDGTQPGQVSLHPAGAFPQVHPGWNNHVTFLRHVGTAPDDVGDIATDGIAWSTTVNWSYHPRYLFVAAP